MLVEAGPHVGFAGDGQHVGLLLLLEEHPQAPGLTVDRVGHHPRRLNASIQGPLEHLPGKFGFGAHLDLLGHPSPLASLFVFGPLFGQIQLPVDESLPPKGSVGQKHPDLAILRLAGGTCVLALDPDAVLSLLDEARLIDDEDRILLAQMLTHVASQVLAHEIGVPVGPTQ
jgi:hypothetical protein